MCVCVLQRKKGQEEKETRKEEQKKIAKKNLIFFLGQKRVSEKEKKNIFKKHFLKSRQDCVRTCTFHGHNTLLQEFLSLHMVWHQEVLLSLVVLLVVVSVLRDYEK